MGANATRKNDWLRSERFSAIHSAAVNKIKRRSETHMLPASLLPGHVSEGACFMLEPVLI